MILEIILWSERLVGFALLLQTVELLRIRENFSDSGIWNWDTLRQEYPKILQTTLSVDLSYEMFLSVLVISAIGGAVLMFFPDLVWVGFLLLALVLNDLLICWRFRGTYNGGSDFMTMVVLIGLTGATMLPSIAKFFLAYIAVQVCLSYFFSGVVKLRKPNWRSGKALQSLSDSVVYPIPSFAQKCMSNGRISRIFSIALIAFECSFPMALLNAEVCRVYLAFAVLFHLLMVYVFGLNRFLWAWLSAYPALYFFSNGLAGATGLR